MSLPDWFILIITITFIVTYGIWRTRGSKNIEGYLLGDNQMKWWTICLSTMGTQASAITFLSLPGQAYESGMQFIQIYLGLPLAMVVICITAIPIYSRLKVFTAYEYLETRFDVKTRALAAFLFLIQRGLSTGITIYAPAIVLSVILGWNLIYTNIIIGVMVILYTVSGGTRAVSVTQEQQMGVIILGMAGAGFMVVNLLPPDVHFADALNIAGRLEKLNLLKFSFTWEDRYNVWSGLLGGFFLSLSYFGTDQSQVGRYLSGESQKESRLGLLFNGVLKVPMQFLILLLGVLIFVFYQFNKPPLIFNRDYKSKIERTINTDSLTAWENGYNQAFQHKKEAVTLLMQQSRENDKNEIKKLQSQIQNYEHKISVYRKALTSVAEKDHAIRNNDSDYVFITFILEYLPHGLIGLLLAVILCAAMSSTSSSLNALASTTCIDVYKRFFNKDGTPQAYLKMSRIFTVLWGVLAIVFAIGVSRLENLIQGVNILGSLFYGTILGIFLVAFYFKYVQSNAVFIAALIAEVMVVCCFFFTSIGFLWYNLIGCLLVVLISYFFQILLPEKFK